MSSLRFLMRQLEPHVALSRLTPGQDLVPDRLELLAGPAEALEADRVYLLAERDLGLLAPVKEAPGAVVLVGEADPANPAPAMPEGCSWVLFSCPVAAVHNALAAAAAQKAEWERAFQALDGRGCGCRAAVALTAELAGDAVLLLDPGGQIMEAARLEDSPYLSGQAAVGTIPLDTMRRVLPRASSQWGEYAVPNTDVLLFGLRLAHGDEEPYGVLLAAGRSSRTGLDVRTLCGCAAAHLDRQLFSGGLEQEGAGAKGLRECWQAIMDGRLTSSGEIQGALARLPNPVRTFVRVVVISFEGEKGVPYRYLITRLREIFPGSNMMVYQRSILILHSQDERVFRLGLDRDQRLIRLLERYNGFMAVSNGTRRLDSLRSMFRLAQRTVTLARALRDDQSRRIFFHEDYAIYCVIDLCVKRYMEEGNDDPLYLMHPAVIHLTRYDREHNSNLRDVLFYYLINDRNLVKTAAAVYMHRNTVINKVNKIIELIQLDLEDARLRQRLILSCQMIRYYEQVMQHEFRP